MAEEKEKRVKVSVVEEEEEVKIDKPEEESVEKSDTEEQQESKTEEKVEIKEPTETKQSEKSPETDKIPFWILFSAFILGLAMGAGLIGGFFYYNSRVEKQEITPTPVSSIPTDQIASPEPVETQDKEEVTFENIKIEILNGSGIAGEAGRVEELLNKSGFTSTDTGNAGSYDYTDTEISVKTDLENSVIKSLKDALSSYELTDSDENLEEDYEYEIKIIVGKSKS